MFWRIAFSRSNRPHSLYYSEYLEYSYKSYDIREEKSISFFIFRQHFCISSINSIQSLDSTLFHCFFYLINQSEWYRSNQFKGDFSLRKNNKILKFNRFFFLCE